MLELAGEVGVSVADLHRLSPWEFSRLVKGYHRRLRRQREQAAEHAAWALIPFGGGRITPADLLGESEPETTQTFNIKDFPSTEAFLQAVREAREKRNGA